MNVRATLFNATHGVVSAVTLVVALVSVWKWVQHWLAGPAPQTMAEAMFWTILLIVLLVPAIGLDRWKSGGE